MAIDRRCLLAAGAGAAVSSPFVFAIAHAANGDKMTMATGLRATVQSTVWIGTKAGIFRKHGLDVEFVKLEVGGPPSAAGLIRGDWAFVQTGSVPMTEAVLQGKDAVIIARNHVPLETNIILTRPEIRNLAQLNGKKVGVLTDVYSGRSRQDRRRRLPGRLSLRRPGPVRLERVRYAGIRRAFHIRDHAAHDRLQP